MEVVLTEKKLYNFSGLKGKDKSKVRRRRSRLDYRIPVHLFAYE